MANIKMIAELSEEKKVLNIKLEELINNGILNTETKIIKNRILQIEKDLVDLGYSEEHSTLISQQKPVAQLSKYQVPANYNVSNVECTP